MITIIIIIYITRGLNNICPTTEWYLMMVDQLFLAIYIMELVLKLYVWRLKYFQQPWNIFGIHTLK